MSECGRCAGHGTIQGLRFDMESSPIESYREPCPQCSEGSSFWVRCFFGCGFRARDITPDEAHDHLDAHYEVAHRSALEYLHQAGFIPYGAGLLEVGKPMEANE